MMDHMEFKDIDWKDIDLKELESAVKELDDDELADSSGGTREYVRCRICKRPNSVIKTYGICQYCLRDFYKNKQNTNEGK